MAKPDTSSMPLTRVYVVLHHARGFWQPLGSHGDAFDARCYSTEAEAIEAFDRASGPYRRFGELFRVIPCIVPVVPVDVTP